MYGSLGYDFGWLSSAQESQEKHKVSIIGFDGIVLRQIEGTMIIEGGSVRYDIEGANLSSGSPVIEHVNGDYLIRGIYSNADESVILDSNLHQSIAEWLNTTFLSIDL